MTKNQFQPVKEIPFLEIDNSLVESKQNLQELFKLSTVGKLFLAGVAAWIVGKASRMKVRGTSEEIDVISRAMLSSKRFQDELGKPGASVQSVMEKLKLKNASAAEFERKLGIRWPL